MIRHFGVFLMNLFYNGSEGGVILKKKYLWSLLLVLGVILLTACQDEAASEDIPQQDHTEDVTPSDEIPDDTAPKEDGSDDDLSEVGDNVEENETEVAEEAVEVAYQINQGNWRVEPLTEEVESKVALLTIDDAPDQYAVEMAHILKDLDVPAIFFVNGHFLETDEKHENLKEIHELGFTIGNHTYNHPNLKDIPVEEQRKQLVTLNDKVEEIIGERPTFFRAPFGANTDDSLAIAREENMVVMNWTYGYDWEKQYQDRDALADIMVNTELLNDGANLLMHDREWTKNALKDIVTGLREKGYTFVDPQAIKGVGDDI
jgi:peptidoglycan/xylan/chitin deacetylase (PgdA/CDA1 family)